MSGEHHIYLHVYVAAQHDYSVLSCTPIQVGHAN